jgi:hypothetical protein
MKMQHRKLAVLEAWFMYLGLALSLILQIPVAARLLAIAYS